MPRSGPMWRYPLRASGWCGCDGARLPSVINVYTPETSVSPSARASNTSPSVLSGTLFMSPTTTHGHRAACSLTWVLTLPVSAAEAGPPAAPAPPSPAPFVASSSSLLPSLSKPSAAHRSSALVTSRIIMAACSALTSGICGSQCRCVLTTRHRWGASCNVPPPAAAPTAAPTSVTPAAAPSTALLDGAASGVLSTRSKTMPCARCACLLRW
mmetsp:Transcript_30741/g.85761  ORF Transcript_30741/g.85761 Transcript_30741/m.85761 type:complete len:212 (-) Transcript_30741:115-750(-)